MIGKPTVSRRTALKLGGAAVALAVLPPLARSSEALRLHGLTVIGDLKYGPDFTHFDYVDPAAPKGGRIVIQSPLRAYNQNFQTFNTLNSYVLRGDGAFGMQYTFAALMASSTDEPGSGYAYAASEVEVAENYKLLRFRLRPEARFHDDMPITAADVAFSLTTLRDKGHPNIATELKGVAEILVEDDSTLVVRLGEETGRSLPLTVATAPIFSAAWWQERNFEAALSVAPLGSGPYRVKNFSFGNFIEFERVADFWAADLPVMRGRFNFDILRYDYYRDQLSAFEALKKGTTTFREEFTSRIWARDYNFPSLLQGKVVLDELPDGTPSGAQGWYFNTRRTKFADPRVREALGYAFDFEWTNANLMFNSYQRSSSYFENSPMKAEGKPSAEELALLEPFRDKLDPAVFGEVYVPPVSDGSGRDRKLRGEALAKLTEAGCRLEGNRLLLPDGRPLTIEFLDDDSRFEPHHNAYINGLRSIGVAASYRVVDATQYTERLKSFDFDMTVSRFVMGLTPDEGIYQFFSSRSANQPGSFNMSAVADPVVDALLDKIVHATDWDAFVHASRAVDRVLRAGHYCVPQWHKASHWIAYWDVYSRPAIKPPYDRGVIDTWWYDRDKAMAIGMAG